MLFTLLDRGHHRLLDDDEFVLENCLLVSIELESCLYFFVPEHRIALKRLVDFAAELDFPDEILFELIKSELTVTIDIYTVE